MMPRHEHIYHPHVTMKDTEHGEVKEFSQGHQLDCPDPTESDAEFVFVTANIYYILL